MARKIFGGFLIFAACVAYTSISEDQDRVGMCIAALIYLVCGLYLIIKKPPTQEQREAAKQAKAERQRQQREARERQKEMESRFMQGEHMTGLPLAPGAACSVFFKEDYAKISSSGLEFRLAFAKIIDLQLVTDVEIQKSYVSSIGGAVGGSLLFGSLGAMIGGRAKEKTSEVVEYYFVITYNKEGLIEYFSLRVSDTKKAKKIIERYKPQLSSFRGVIDM